MWWDTDILRVTAKNHAILGIDCIIRLCIRRFNNPWNNNILSTTVTKLHNSGCWLHIWSIHWDNTHQWDFNICHKLHNSGCWLHILIIHWDNTHLWDFNICHKLHNCGCWLHILSIHWDNTHEWDFNILTVTNYATLGVDCIYKYSLWQG